MVATSSPDNAIFPPQEYRVEKGLSAYVAELAHAAPGVIIFRTGAGRLLRDLLIHWPIVPAREEEAQEICNRIAEAVYPLARQTLAQGIEISIRIFAKPIAPITHVDSMSSFTLIDATKGIQRLLFLSPRHKWPEAELLSADCGIAALCRPLHYNYHAIKDDRKRSGHPHAGMFELSQRLINEMYEQPNFVPRERALLATLQTKFQEMPKIMLQDASARAVNLSLRTRGPRPTPVIAAVTSLSALPPPVRVLERRLMNHVLDRSLSPALRIGLRQLAQSLRGLFPQAVITDAAAHVTARHEPLFPPSYAYLPVYTQEPRPSLQPVAKSELVLNSPISRSQSITEVAPYPLERRAQPYEPTPVAWSVHPSIVIPALPLWLRAHPEPTLPPNPSAAPQAPALRANRILDVEITAQPNPQVRAPDQRSIIQPTPQATPSRPAPIPQTTALRSGRVFDNTMSAPQPTLPGMHPLTHADLEPASPQFARRITVPSQTAIPRSPASIQSNNRKPESPKPSLQASKAKMASPSITPAQPSMHDTARVIPQARPSLAHTQLPHITSLPTQHFKPRFALRTVEPVETRFLPKLRFDVGHTSFHHAADFETKPSAQFRKTAPAPITAPNPRFPLYTPEFPVGRLHAAAHLRPALSLHAFWLQNLPIPEPAPLPRQPFTKSKK